MPDSEHLSCVCVWVCCVRLVTLSFPRTSRLVKGHSLHIFGGRGLSPSVAAEANAGTGGAGEAWCGGVCTQQDGEHTGEPHVAHGASRGSPHSSASSTHATQARVAHAGDAQAMKGRGRSCTQGQAGRAPQDTHARRPQGAHTRAPHRPQGRGGGEHTRHRETPQAGQEEEGPAQNRAPQSSQPPAAHWGHTGASHPGAPHVNRCTACCGHARPPHAGQDTSGQQEAQ